MGAFRPAYRRAFLVCMSTCLLEGLPEARLLGDHEGLPINGVFWPVYQLALGAT